MTAMSNDAAVLPGPADRDRVCLDEFVSYLRDIPFDVGAIDREDLRGIAAPAGICEVRYFDAETGRWMGEMSVRASGRHLTAACVGDAMFLHRDYRGRTWVRATARPAITSGILELDVETAPIAS